MARIELTDLNLTFRITKYGPVRFRDWMRSKLQPQISPIIEVHALKDINLRLRDGDRVGIIGHNGAGKSTLLKVMADIYPVTSGSRNVEGRISSLFDLILGFEMDANGWENIAYRGYLQGETQKSVRGKMQEIADFSGLGDYLDMPVRYYSDGMRTRLAFAIATAIEPDILLVDEAINAGDLAFRKKAQDRIRNVMSKAQIVIAVSHDHAVLEQLCERLIWMDHGSIMAVGEPQDVIEQYIGYGQELQAQAA